MIERATQLFAASALMLGPVGTVDAPQRSVERVYVREEEQGQEGESIQLLRHDDMPLPAHPQVKRLGHFVHRLAGRNHQMGHRYRG